MSRSQRGNSTSPNSRRHAVANPRFAQQHTLPGEMATEGMLKGIKRRHKREIAETAVAERNKKIDGLLRKFSWQ